MPHVVPLRIRIGLRPGGREADHPNWNVVPLPHVGQLHGDGTNPDDYVHGSWHYDSCCGHQDSTPDSPIGMQWGVRLVTPAFAQAAIASLGAEYQASILSEADWEAFYDNHCRGHMPENRANMPVLEALKLELDLRTALGEDTTALKAKIKKALDPDDAEPGFRRDLERHWQGFKKCHGLTCGVEAVNGQHPH